MKDKFISLYCDVAERVSQLSHAQRLKVGAVIVKDDRILSYGYNGMPSGFDNVCETEVFVEIDGIVMMNIPENRELVTKSEVVHAEMNAIAKVAKHTDSCEGASIFITHSPCVECAKLILQSGISRVYYVNSYRSSAGIELLKKGDVEVIKQCLESI